MIIYSVILLIQGIITGVWFKAFTDFDNASKEFLKINCFFAAGNKKIADKYFKKIIVSLIMAMIIIIAWCCFRGWL